MARFTSNAWALVSIQTNEVIQREVSSQNLAKTLGWINGSGKMSIKQLVYKTYTYSDVVRLASLKDGVVYVFNPSHKSGAGQMEYIVEDVKPFANQQLIDNMKSAFETECVVEPTKTETKVETIKTPKGQESALEMLQTALTMLSGTAQIDKAEVEKIVDERLKGVKPLSVEVVFAESVQRIEKAHENFPKLVKMLGAKMNVALIGEAGSGKSVAAVQSAQALNLDYYTFSFNQKVMPHDLVGFMSPITGDYVPSNIRKAYENGGVLILDEFDRANTEVTIALNGMLANDDYLFPDGMVKKHEEFRVVACQNTCGLGGSKVYASARRQDGSTLNRFVKLEFNIDSKLELAICGDTEVTRAVQQIRANAKSLSMDDVLVTPRQAIDGNKLVSIGFSLKDAIEHTCLVGLADDMKKRLLNGVSL